MEAIREAILAALEDDHPQTVRGTFYLLSVVGVVPKTDDARGYGTVQRLLAEMRRAGVIPYGWIADATRWMRKPKTYSSVEQALRRTAETYRRALWDEGDVYVEVWLEKEALAGVLAETTSQWDVPLMVCRGYPSISFLHSAAEEIANRQQWTQIYYLGDHDPSGRDIDRAVREGIGESLEAITPGYDFDAHATFERLAVTERQIEEWRLPTRPTKSTDTRSKSFKGESVELDAIPAGRLRQLVAGRIESHVDQHQLGVLQKTEAEERRLLMEMAKTFNGGPS
jgi:hypothetical protein